MRLVTAFLAGALFGAGLLLSGMTDTRKIQGWLDFFGDWDPTLAFVFAGALLPMILAWRVAASRERAALGTAMPRAVARAVDGKLLLGSALFGIGWALAGFCPGPALASLGFGGNSGVMFVAAMVIGMIGAKDRTQGAAAAP